MAVQGTAYAGFGSFHSDNVEELASQSDDEYKPPPIPTDLCKPDFPSYDVMIASLLEPLGAADRGKRRCFGAAMLDSGMFLLDRQWTFLNHGAFGSTCLPALRAAEYWRRHTERQPLLSFDRVLLPHVVRVVRASARLLGARRHSDLVLVPNATQGLWAALQSCAAALGPGDTILTLDIGYGSVKKMVREVARRTGARHRELAVRLPFAEGATRADVDDEILALIGSALSDGDGDVKLVLVDAMTSNTALCLPVRRVTRLCHQHGAAVVVDAAHALGQMPVDVGDWGADVVVGNFHKWWCSARGAAFLYWDSEAAMATSHFAVPQPSPLVISHGYGCGMQSEFSWDGNRDYSAWLALDAAERFWDAVGVDAARDYCTDLLREAAAMLRDDWSTRTLAPLGMCCMMGLVELPTHLRAAPSSGQAGYTSENAKFIQDALHYEHRIEVPIKCVSGRLWVRISAAVYNTLDDYRRLSTVILEIFNGKVE